MQLSERGQGRLLGNQKGSVLAVLLTAVAVIAVVSYVVMRLMSQVMNQLGDEDMQVEAQMLASDMKEYTKYLLAYEKVFYTKNPLTVGTDRQAALEDLWGQGYAAYDADRSLNMMNVCGGYGMDLRFSGTLEIDGDPVFCPAYVRDPNRTGRETEDMLFEQWANPKRHAFKMVNYTASSSKMAPVFSIGDGPGESGPLPSGHYRIRLDFSNGDRKWFVNSDNTVALNVGQNLFEFMKDSSLNFDLTAEVDVDFFTDSFGMRSDFTERFMRVTSRVKLQTPGKGIRIFQDQESFVLRIPTIKDFVIFMPYPVTNAGVPTKLSSQALNLTANSQVFGRVYFNGDIDTPLKELPEFLEPVFISGVLKTPVSNAETALFRQKFRRGLVTNLSVSRFLFSGVCPANSTNPEIINGVAMKCSTENGAGGFRPYEVDDLLEQGQSVCRCDKLTVGSLGKLIHAGISDIGSCGTAIRRPDLCPDDNSFVKNGYYEVTVSNAAQLAFIASQVKKLTVQRKVNIYGVIVGGHISAPQGATFYGITAMKQGQPGIGNPAEYSARTLEVNAIGSGISAPLPNLPLIQFVKDGFK